MGDANLTSQELEKDVHKDGDVALEDVISASKENVHESLRIAEQLGYLGHYK